MSIYNDNGIKAAALFDNKLAFTCEIAVPLRLLSLSAAAGETFSYQVRVNEVTGQSQTVGGGAGGQVTYYGAGSQTGQPATDFKGEYTLIQR